MTWLARIKDYLQNPKTPVDGVTGTNGGGEMIHDTVEPGSGSVADAIPSRPHIVLRILRMMFTISETVVMLCGMMFVFILATYGLSHLRGEDVSEITLEISIGRFMEGNLPYVWLGVVIVYSGGMIARAYTSLKQGWKKYREKKDTGGWVSDLRDWLLNN